MPATLLITGTCFSTTVTPANRGSQHPVSEAAALACALEADVIAPDGFFSAKTESRNGSGKCFSMGNGNLREKLSRICATESYDQFVVLESSLLRALKPGKLSPITLVCGADEGLRELRGSRRAASAVTRVVARSPLQHLAVSESWRIARPRIELLAPAVDVDFFAPDDSARDVNRVVLASAQGSARAELRAALESGGACVEELTSTATAEERRSAWRRAGVVVLFAAVKASTGGAVLLAEALACGAPVVASRTWGVEHLAGGEGDCLFVPPGDAATTRSAVHRVLSDDTFAGSLACTARAHADAVLSLSRYARCIARVCRRPAAGDGPEYFFIPAHAASGAEESVA